MISPAASLRIIFIVPSTHYSSCVDSSVKDIFFYYLIGTEIRFLNYLFTMDESSDTTTEMDKLSATVVKVFVVDSEGIPIVPASLITANDSQLDESLNDDHISYISLTVEDNQFQSIRVEDRVWNSRMQDEGCEKSKLPKKTYMQSIIP